MQAQFIPVPEADEEEEGDGESEYWDSLWDPAVSARRKKAFLVIAFLDVLFQVRADGTAAYRLHQ